MDIESIECGACLVFLALVIISPFEMLLFWGMLHYKNSTHTILCGLFFHCNPICWKLHILPCWACEIPMGRTTPDHDVGYISYIMLYPTLFPWYPHQLISNCSIKLYYGLLSRSIGHLLRFSESLLFIPPVIYIQHLGNSDGNNCSLSTALKIQQIQVWCRPPKWQCSYNEGFKPSNWPKQVSLIYT